MQRSKYTAKLVFVCNKLSVSVLATSAVFCELFSNLFNHSTAIILLHFYFAGQSGGRCKLIKCYHALAIFFIELVTGVRIEKPVLCT